MSELARNTILLVQENHMAVHDRSRDNHAPPVDGDCGPKDHPLLLVKTLLVVVKCIRIDQHRWGGAEYFWPVPRIAAA